MVYWGRNTGKHWTERREEAMKGKNGILLLLLAALVLGPILWQIALRPMVTPEEAEQTAEPVSYTHLTLPTSITV